MLLGKKEKRKVAPIPLEIFSVHISTENINYIAIDTMKQYIIKQDTVRQIANFPRSCFPALRKQRSNKHELELQ